MIRSLWRYRAFVLGMARREFEARYRGSVLGSLWAVLNPLTMVFIYTVIFGHVMKSRVPGATFRPCRIFAVTSRSSYMPDPQEPMKA